VWRERERCREFLDSIGCSFLFSFSSFFLQVLLLLTDSLHSEPSLREMDTEEARRLVQSLDTNHDSPHRRPFHSIFMQLKDAEALLKRIEGGLSAYEKNTEKVFILSELVIKLFIFGNWGIPVLFPLFALESQFCSFRSRHPPHYR